MAATKRSTGRKSTTKKKTPTRSKYQRIQSKTTSVLDRVEAKGKGSRTAVRKLIQEAYAAGKVEGAKSCSKKR